MYSLGLDIMLIPMINIKPYRAPTMAKPRQESIKSPDGPTPMIYTFYTNNYGSPPPCLPTRRDRSTTQVAAFVLTAPVRRSTLLHTGCRCKGGNTPVAC